VLIGMEVTGNSPVFVELVEDLAHAIWIGDAAQIRASYVRKQKTDKRNAAYFEAAGGTSVSALAESGPRAARPAATGAGPIQRV
jgi:hypothetical protein